MRRLEASAWFWFFGGARNKRLQSLGTQATARQYSLLLYAQLETKLHAVTISSKISINNPDLPFVRPSSFKLQALGLKTQERCSLSSGVQA